MAVESVIAELLIEIGVEAPDAEKAAKKIKGVTESAGELDKKGGASVKGFSKTFVVTAGDIAKAAISAGKALFNFVDGITSAGDQVAKSARAAGLGAEEYQRLTFAADRSGASQEAVAKSARNVSKFFAEAKAKGATPFTQALDQVGLSIRDLEGLSFEDRLGLIADSLNRVGDQSERTALAQKLLGEEAGPQLASLLESGSAGLKDLGDEAERLGIVMGEDALKQSEAFQDQLTNLKATFTGMATTVGTELLPVFSEIIGEVQDWVLANRDLIGTQIKEFIRDMVPQARALLSSLVDLLKVLFEMIGAFKDFAAALGIGPESALGLMLALKAATSGMPGLFAAAGTAGFIAGQKIAEGFSVAVLGGQKLEDQLRNIQRLQRETANIKAGNEALKQIRDAIASGEGLGNLSEQQFENLLVEAGRGAAESGISEERYQGIVNFARRQRESQQQELGSARAQREAAKASASADVRFQARQQAIRRLREQFGEGRNVTKIAQQLGTGAITEEQAFEQAAKARGGRGGRGRAKPTKTEKTSLKQITSLEEFLGLTAEQQQGIASNLRVRSEKVAEPIKPEAVLNITNNTFTVTQTITGNADPVEIGKEAAKAIKQEFDIRLARAGQAAQTNVAR